MTMLGSVLRMLDKSSSLTRPKEVLKETKRTIYGKPPRHRVGAAQSFFVMSVFAAAMLAPAAWILYHLPTYRERAQQGPRT
ncbi:COX8 domain-containing protein [Poeciliopsis prolifica]|uniref:COX8 domain-containing protein n=1 Tax=Poeciliopsis prolifica TaxID=188132 RepID=UPI00241401DA|nr:COX8 domain-containing protein [Poeciliopsis prolifica]